MTIRSEDLFDLGASRLGSRLRDCYPWEVLERLGDEIRALGERLSPRLYHRVGEDVWIARDAHVSERAELHGPCVIGEGSEVRCGAYIRGSALIGDGCVVGNSTEIKNAILFDGVTAPHYTYIGDSVLGRGVHLGAGVILSNLRFDKGEITVRSIPPVGTGRRKLGAILGDGCEIGCHAVLNPGCVLGRGSHVYPLTSVTGVWEAGSLIRGEVK